MRDHTFRFKQFSLQHHLCPMPIGTDGVLLGAWADVSNATTVLDIGTGCGLIALMIAQRQPDATIHAIDLHAGAVEQACANFKDSPWPQRLTAWLADFVDYADSCTTQYNLIVSNPPFYTEDTLSPDKSRANARNAQSLPFDALICGCAKILAPNGHLCIITPYTAKDAIECAVQQAGLFEADSIIVRPTPTAPPHRILWNICRERPSATTCSEMAIELARHVYTQEYTNLTKDFYLKM